MSLKLPVYNDRTPVTLTPEKQGTIMKSIKTITSALAFFTARMAQNNVKNTDVDTCMGLLEHNVADLSKATGYDGILAKEVEERHAEIRKLNKRIRELEEERGKAVSATAVSAAIRRYEDVFRAWYESCGFRYASIEYSAYGFRADFSAELNHVRERHLARSNEELARFAKMTTFIPESADWDVIKDDYHDELADTDKNRQNLIRLFTEAFSDVIVNEFKGRKNDFGSFSLRINVYVSYEDIEKLERRLMALEE